MSSEALSEASLKATPGQRAQTAAGEAGVPDAPARAGVIHEADQLSQAGFDTFAQLSGDANPIHVDPAFAAATPFGATVSHGMLLFSRLRGLLARHYPGMTLQAQTLMFPAPTYADVPLRWVLTPQATDGPAVRRLAVALQRPDGPVGLQGECWLHAGAAAADVPSAEATLSAADSTAVPAQFPELAQLAPGQQASLTRTYTADDLATWQALAAAPWDGRAADATLPTADTPSAAAGTVPEPLIAALFSCLLGESLPGHGTNYLKQEMQFARPARVGEALTAQVTVQRVRGDKALVDLQTDCRGADGALLCTGRALVRFAR